MQPVFVGRDNELDAMNNLYAQKRFQMVVLYGRRRVGKTTLISKFIEDKPAIFYTAQEASDSINLAAFSRKTYRFFGIPETVGSFRSWDDAFAFLSEKAQTRQFVLAFDEFPYAAHENRGLGSILQNRIDHGLKETKLYLILCGSQVGFMESEVLGYRSPLFGRRTSQIKLEGFDYYDAAKMLEPFNIEDKIKIYSCIGGTPHYLAQVNPDETFEENIKRLFFDISGYLYSEPMMLLQQELREPATYNSIISAIAAGDNRPGEIGSRLGEESSKVVKYLQTLIDLQIIRKDYPFGEDPGSSRKGVYRIADFFYHFWYRFVFPHKPEIETGSGHVVADNEVFGEQLSTYVGKPPFEAVCLQYLNRLNRIGRLPFPATSHGTWWGNDPKTKQQADFDIVMANKSTGKIILGECKWKNSLDDVEEIGKLTGKTHLLSDYKDRWYYLFSKAPFSGRAKEMASARLHLITPDMLFDV